MEKCGLTVNNYEIVQNKRRKIVRNQLNEGDTQTVLRKGDFWN